MKTLDVLKTAALFLIAAGLFAMSFVIHDALGKHGRYAPVSYDDDQVVVMDTHSGRVWSVNYEENDSAGLTIQTPGAAKLHTSLTETASGWHRGQAWRAGHP